MQIVVGMPLFEGLSENEINYVLREILEIERMLSKIEGRVTKPDFDTHIFEYNTRDFWDIELKKKNDAYEMKVTIKFLNQHFELFSNNLTGLIHELKNKMAAFKKHFIEWLKLMAK